MNKKKYNPLFLVLLILIAVFAVSFFWLRTRDSKTKNIEVTETPTPLTSASNAVINETLFKKISIKNESEYSKVDIEYPEFVDVDATYNTQIKNFVDTLIKDHNVESAENWKARFETQLEGEKVQAKPTSDEKFQLYGRFEPVQVNSSYISGLFVYGGFTGGAHGYEDFVAYHYDIKAKKELALQDILANKKTDYLDYLSTASRLELKKKLMVVSEEDKKESSAEAMKEYLQNTEDMINTGTEPKVENFRGYTFTDKDITIRFSQYQVGPYVIGQPEVVIQR